MVQTEEYLTDKKNIGREEATTTKKYILLLLKMIGTAILIVVALPLALMGVALYFLFKFLGITSFYIRDKQDSETLSTYELQRNRGVHPDRRIITEKEAKEIKERQDAKRKNCE